MDNADSSDADSSNVEWLTNLRPDKPIVITAFSGWNDAGDAATQAVRFLRQRTDASPLANIDPETYFDFIATRPNVVLNDDGKRSIEWPETKISASTLPGSDQPIVLVEGIEPQLRWRGFTSQITSIAVELNASLIVSMGALLADVPHSRPVEIYGTADNPDTADELDLATSTYEGPTGIVGVLAARCSAAGLPTASLWAAVPAYVPGAGSPKAALALVKRLQLVLDFGFDTTELEIAASAYERQVNELISDDHETAEYVAELEAQYDSAGPKEPSAEFLVAEVENFLRQQDS